MSFSLNSQVEESLETLGLLIPPAVLIALVGVLFDAVRGSRPMPSCWRHVARLALGLLVLALAPTLCFLAWSLNETVRLRSWAEMFLLSASGFVTLALGMGLFAWSFILRASSGRPAIRSQGAADDPVSG